MQHYKHSCAAVVLSTVLMACSGGDDPSGELITPPITKAPEVNAPKVIAGPLSPSADLASSMYLRNGLFYQTLGNTKEVTAPVSDGGFSGSFSGFSSTTTQEVDVDEADRIEFDGQTLYVAGYPVWGAEQESSGVRVLSKQGDGSLIEVANIEQSEEHNIQGMYLNAPENDKLAVLSGNVGFYPIEILFAEDGRFTTESIITLNVHNVAQPNEPDLESAITIEGHLLSSRRVGQSLYVVSTFSPELPDVELGAETEQDRLANYLKILDMDDESLLPGVTFNGVEQSLYSADDCFIPASASENDGFSHLIQVLKVDLANNNSLQAMCAITSVDFIYMSSQSLYLAGQIDNETQLHKIGLDNALTVAASGRVNGVAGWNNPHLRLSERDGALRIVTSDYQTDPENPFHRLFVLEQQGNTLNILSQLPNAEAEQGLGKPGEDVYAVRYVGDKGYVVTFERIDPLYVIDLSEPASPTLLGELEIPGFSSYLQPVGEDFLLGVGQQVDTSLLPPNGQEQVTVPVTVNQMKVSLFDVRDPQTPLELSSILIPDAYTPVEYDYRALSMLASDDYARFAMPVESWGQRDEEGHASYGNWLMVLDLDKTASAPSLSIKARLSATEQAPHYIYAGEDRSILVGNDVYYLRGNQLWYSPQADEEELHGPY